MKRILWAITAAALLTFGACEATDEGTDATTDQTPACTASASSVYDGCIQFKTKLCAKLVSCAIYADAVECGNWFDSEDGFAGCDQDFTDPVADAAKFQDCICSIPGETCQAIQQGVLTALPSCGEWVPAQ
ncbi:hypothetical protein KBD49_11390 [Myxococcota bacterium]|jgi:hypothetical protein|nr:hypothetical protein [Myxococcota bacterium]